MVGKVEKITLGTDKHAGDVTSLIFFNNVLISGGADGKIKIWDSNLILIKTIDAHEAHVYAMAIDGAANNGNGRLYSSSADGTIKYIDNPIESPLSTTTATTILMNENDAIQTLCYVDDFLYSGDDKGVVTKWANNRIQFKYNLIEEIHSMAIEKKLIYTARNLDTVISEVSSDGTSGKYTTRAVMPGRAPLLLIGPAHHATGNRRYLLFTTRDGKGITLVKNEIRFEHIWTHENAHEMIINAICSKENVIYTGGWDGIVKKWVEYEKVPLNGGEIKIGVCINVICNGPLDYVFVGGTDGMIRKVNFSSAAA